MNDNQSQIVPQQIDPAGLIQRPDGYFVDAAGYPRTSDGVLFTQEQYDKAFGKIQEDTRSSVMSQNIESNSSDMDFPETTKTPLDMVAQQKVENVVTPSNDQIVAQQAVETPIVQSNSVQNTQQPETAVVQGNHSPAAIIQNATEKVSQNVQTATTAVDPEKLQIAADTALNSNKIIQAAKKEQKEAARDEIEHVTAKNVLELADKYGDSKVNNYIDSKGSKALQRNIFEGAQSDIKKLDPYSANRKFIIARRVDRKAA